MSVLELITLIFAVLKALDMVEFSWVYVFAPLFASMVFNVITFIFITNKH